MALSRLLVKRLTLDFPLPPSVNAAFVSRAGGRRIRRSAEYAFWVGCVCDEFPDREKIPTIGDAPYFLEILLPVSMRGDVDNRIKLLSDMLSAPTADHDYRLGVVTDDKRMLGCIISRHASVPDKIARVTIDADR